MLTRLRFLSFEYFPKAPRVWYSSTMPLTMLTALPVVLLALFASACANQPATIVMLPDTQFYSEKHPEIFHDQTRWIAEHIDEENIRFVTHVGDVVQNYDQVEAEWVAADAAMDRLNGLVPVGVAIGNHDYDLGSDGKPFRQAKSFVKWFGPERFEGEPWFGGAHPNGLNSYQIFEMQGRRFLFLHLESDVPDEIISWAEGVIAQYPGVPTIVTTHIYISDRTRARTTEPYLVKTGNSGEAIWSKFIRKNSQIFMVLCGHYDTVGGEWRQASTNDEGREVFEVLADFQSREKGGNGWLRVIRFDETDGKISFHTYSPTLDAHESDDNSEFFFYLDFDERFN